MPNSMPQLLRSILGLLIIVAAIAILGLYFIAVPIEGTNLAMDWEGLWLTIDGTVPLYSSESSLRIPPWSLIPVLPLGWTSFRVSWALVSFATLAVLVLSVPRSVDTSRKTKVAYWVAVFGLVLSYPSLRVIADGNLEYLVIAGILLLEYAYAARKPALLVLGALLAASKVQETWLLLMFLPLFLWGNWSPRDWLKGVLTFALVTIPSLYWKGPEWLSAMFAIEFRGSIMDSSLPTILKKFGLPSPLSITVWVLILILTLVVTWKSRRTLSRRHLGFLIAASLLLAPYAAGNSYLTIYSIGVIPLAQSLSPAGLTLVVLTNLPYLLFLKNRALMYNWSALYWSLMFCLSWIVLGVNCLKSLGGNPQSRAESPDARRHVPANIPG